MPETSERLASIEQRNARVEADKGWETSLTRRLLISVFTYLSVLLYGYAIGVRSPALNAVVPTVGFVLSTLTLPVVKRRWIARRLARGA